MQTFHVTAAFIFFMSILTGADPFGTGRPHSGKADRVAVPFLAGHGPGRTVSGRVHAELFGLIEYGMTMNQIKRVLPNGRGFQVEYTDDKSVTLHWSTTMWGECANVHLQMMGSGQTLSAVVVVIENCEKTIVNQSGVSLSLECQEVTTKIARYLEERYGAPRTEWEPYAEGDGYLEKMIWMSPTSEIYFVFTKSGEYNGADRFEVSTAPLLVFEPQK